MAEIVCLFGGFVLQGMGKFQLEVELLDCSHSKLSTVKTIK